MATVERKKNGYYLAKWYAKSGERATAMTTTRQFERALKQANHFEAEARFWELADDGIWSFFAGLQFSPDFCHQNFTHRAHVTRAEFKKLLREAKVEFSPAKQWRDRKKPNQRAQKRYRFQGKMVSLEDALRLTGSKLSVEALRQRMKKCESLEEALALSKK